MLSVMKTALIVTTIAPSPASYRMTADQVEVSLDGEAVRVVRYVTFDEPVYMVHVTPGMLGDSSEEHCF